MPDANDPLAERPIGLAMAVALTALAGAVDACGLARLGDLFVSFMSGNTTSLGLALGRGEWSRAHFVATLVALFVLGGIAGEILGIAAGRWRVPAVTAAVAAGLAVPLAAPGVTVTAMVLAMGALNAAMQRAGGTSVSLTFISGALVRLGRGLGQWLCGRRDGWGWLRQAAPWLGLLAGAAAAAWMQADLGAGTIWPLPLAAAALAALAWRIDLAQRNVNPARPPRPPPG
jgi:uncharacterized membrane protein YoaK (UPF0700 family)